MHCDLVRAAACAPAGAVPEADLWRWAAALAPLAGSLQGADARGALAAATAALARLLPALARPARLLAALNSVAASSVRTALPALCMAAG